MSRWDDAEAEFYGQTLPAFVDSGSRKRNNSCRRDKMNDKRLKQAKLLLDFYFAPWGAAKGEIWEGISGDAEFNATNIGALVHIILKGQRELTEEEVKFLNIVVS